MAGDDTLLRAVREGLVTPLTRAHLTFPVAGQARILSLGLCLEESCSQNGEGQGLVLVLGAFALYANLKTRRQMLDEHGAIGFVAMLPACTGPSHGCDCDVLVLDMDLDVARLWEDGHCYSGGVDSTFSLGRRRPLPAVPS